MADAEDNDRDGRVIEVLTPMFPQLTERVIRTSVMHPSNRGLPCEEMNLIQRCIDDLLELRTLTNDNSNDTITVEETHEFQNNPKDDVIDLASGFLEPANPILYDEPPKSINGWDYVPEGQAIDLTTGHCNYPVPFLENRHVYGDPWSGIQQTNANFVNNAPSLPIEKPTTMTLSSENNQQKIKTSSAASTLPEEDYNEVIQDIWREMNKNSEPAPVEQLSFPAYKPPATSTAINGNTVIPASHATASHATAPHATVSHATVSHATTPALPTLDLENTDIIEVPALASHVTVKTSKVKRNFPVVTTAEIVEVASYGSHATSKTSNVLNASTEESTIDYHKFMHEPPTVTEEKSTKDKIKEEISQVCLVFEDIDPAYVEEQLGKSKHAQPMNALIEYILEHGYPKKTSKVPTSSTPTVPKVESPVRDFYKIDESRKHDFIYRDMCCKLIQNQFTKISMKDLRYVLYWCDHNYAVTHKVLSDALKESGIPYDNSTHKFHFTMEMAGKKKVKLTKVDGAFSEYRIVTILKNGRCRVPVSSVIPSLVAEVDFITSRERGETEKADHELACEVNTTEYVDADQAIECGCCFGDYSFETMVQCYEGHLFCRSCLLNYAREAVFGQGKSNLVCMTDGCDEVFPRNQLSTALPQDVLEKYDERCKEESLNIAELENLVRCPHCDFAAVVDPDIKVFHCQKPECGKETCRFCKEDWSIHFGIPCNELEQKDETKLRLAYEEKMTMAKIRICHSCKAGFTKIDGCNKMTCRCGAKMCYICRKPKIDYNHFCRHLREPGKQCQTCKDCSLWTDPKEDDDRAIQEIKREAQDARKEKGFEESRDIGAPDEPVSKKQRIY